MGTMRPFTLVLIALFVINALFNFYYRWEGIVFIARVYLFLYAFYIVYNISQLDLNAQKQIYIEKYGAKGIHRLFLVSRVIPFLLIYFVTMIFILVTYIGSNTQYWLTEAIFDILNGKYGNTIIYALLLLVILKIKKGPYVTIPLFLAVSFFYLFLFDKLVYSFFNEGFAISLIKIIKYMAFFYFFIFEFYYKERHFIRPLFPVIISSALFHLLLTFIFFMFYTFSPFASTSKIKSAQMLMYWGFSFPITYMNNMVISSENYEYISSLIKYSELYNKEITFNNAQWGKFLDNCNSENLDDLTKYLKQQEISLPYEFLLNYAVKQINMNDKVFINNNGFNGYFADIAKNHIDDFLVFFNSAAFNEKLWCIKIFELCKSIKAVPVLIDLLTDVNDDISLKAWYALREITEYDPPYENDFHQNSLDIVNGFRKFYLEHCKDQI
jgi:hypothetical protein